MYAEQFGISIRESEELYRDIRFYAHGIATQLYGGNMTLGEEEIQGLLHHALERFLQMKNLQIIRRYFQVTKADRKISVFLVLSSIMANGRICL